MNELKELNRAVAARAVSTATQAIGSCLMRVGWLVLVAGIATKRRGRDAVEVLQR